MFKRVSGCLVAVSAVLAITNPVVTAEVPNLPVGSKVFIAPMDGFDRYFRAATKGAEFPLVFVKKRAEAVYEVTGTSKEVPPDVADVPRVRRTTRQFTTITVTNIESGAIVFTHSVQTEISSPDADRTVRAGRTRTPSWFLTMGRETAARRCAQALQDALTP